jgi:hypothetical protein
MSNTSASAGSASVGSSGFWKSLSPNTRRNVKIGVAVCIATDAFVLYKYPGVFGLKTE